MASKSPNLFGVIAVHSPESCPLNNKKSREIFLQIGDKLKVEAPKHGVKNVVGFYMSVLEHQWIIILEASDAHSIESLCITSGISAVNTVKIIPLNRFENILELAKKANSI